MIGAWLLSVICAFGPDRSSWVERSVIYRIDPDRFENGDKSNDPPSVVAWESSPTSTSRFGGDVAGVRQRLDYLEDLGIDTVELCPVFASPSIDRRGTADFRKIDPEFGTNNEFVDLSEELQRRKIRLAIDVVVDHVASTFPPFVDVVDKGEASPYKDWFRVKSYPVRVQNAPTYDVWHDEPTMPILAMTPECAAYLIQALEYWRSRTGLAGVRIAEVEAVARTFGPSIQKWAYLSKPAVWILGEIEAGGRPSTESRVGESQASDAFRRMCVDFFVDRKTKPSEFMARMMDEYRRTGPDSVRTVVNCLDGPDTPRFATLCRGRSTIVQMAAAMEFGWVGVPSIYYGDEICMEGGAVPNNRRPMDWSKATADNTTLKYYKAMIASRKADPALQSGEPEALMTNDEEDTLAFGRRVGTELAIIAMNRSRSQRDLTIHLSPAQALGVLAPNGYVNVLDGSSAALGRDNTLRISLAGEHAAILVPAQPARW